MEKVQSIVRILMKNDETSSQAGMGFVISREHVLTCTHVVCDALQKSGNKELTREEGPVFIHFKSSFTKKQILEAHVELSYGCSDDRPCRDFTVLRLKDLLPDDFPFAPLVNFKKNSIVCRNPCNCYCDDGGNIFGWGDGFITDEVHGGSRIQINQFDKGSGRLISKGFSGSPVWVDGLGGVVGMIDQANKSDNRIATFIPMSVLVDYLPRSIVFTDVPDHVREEKVPKLPVDYIYRTSLLSKLKSILLDEYSKHKKKIIVLLGPSGSGKTSIALDIYHNQKRQAFWFDCVGKSKYPTKDSFLKEIGDSELVFIDNLDSNHKMISENWFNNINATVIVTASMQQVAELVLMNNNCNVADGIFPIEGLEKEEAIDYIKTSSSGNSFSEKQVEFIFEKTGGLVILIKFFIEISNQQHVDRIKESLADLLPQITTKFLFIKKNVIPEISKEEMIKQLVNRWLLLEEHADILPLIMMVLCKIPINGMSVRVLKYLLNEKVDEKALHEILLYLVSKGFVSLKDSKLAKNSNALLVPHSLIKENLIYDGSIVSQYKCEYLRLFENPELSFINDAGEFLNLAMIKMKSLFDDFHFKVFDTDAFFDKFNSLAGKIEQQIPKDAHDFVDSVWIAQLFKDSIPKAECSALISLGQMVKRMPAHGILADCIWQGATNYDSWARGCCIHAAVDHWLRLGDNETGINNLLEWIDIYLNDKYIFNKKRTTNKPYGNQVEMDMAAAFGGICNLGKPETAIKILNSQSFRNYFELTTTSDLTVIIYLIGNNRKEKAQGLIDRNFSKVINSKARRIAEEYIKTAGLYVDCTKSSVEITDESFSLTIASASGNEKFFDYVRRYDPDSRTFIG